MPQMRSGDQRKRRNCGEQADRGDEQRDPVELTQRRRVPEPDHARGATAGWPATRCSSGPEPMLRPSSAASTAVSPSGASSGTSSRVADRLVSRLASTVASTATSSRSTKSVPRGQHVAHPVAEEPGRRAPRRRRRGQSTKSANAGCAAATASGAVSSPRRRAHSDQHDRGRARDPERVDAERRADREADQHQRRPRRAGTGGSGGIGSDRAPARARRGQLAPEEQPQRDVLHDQDDRQHRRHHQREAAEGEVEVRHRQQVGEVGDREQQRGGVRHPQAGVGAGAVRRAGADRGRRPRPASAARRWRPGSAPRSRRRPAGRRR